MTSTSQPGGAAGYDTEAYRAGERARSEVLGEAHVAAARERASDFSEEFQDFLTLHAWGAVWARPGLDRRTRSALTIAILAATHNDGEIPMHVRAAVRNGLSADEIREVIFHTAVYAGIPVANHAMALADHTLRDLGLAAPTGTSAVPPRAASTATSASGGGATPSTGATPS